MSLGRMASPRYGCNVGSDVMPARQGRDTVGLRSYLRRVRYDEMQKGWQLNFASLFPNRLARATLYPLTHPASIPLLAPRPTHMHTLRTCPCNLSHSMIYNSDAHLVNRNVHAICDSVHIPPRICVFFLARHRSKFIARSLCFSRMQKRWRNWRRNVTKGKYAVPQTFVKIE